jgi:hypothetical protein
MNKQNDITWAFSYIAWEAINTLETYCPEKLGDIKSKMEKLNDEWLRLVTPNNSPLLEALQEITGQTNSK